MTLKTFSLAAAGAMLAVFQVVGAAVATPVQWHWSSELRAADNDALNNPSVTVYNDRPVLVPAGKTLSSNVQSFMKECKQMGGDIRVRGFNYYSPYYYTDFNNADWLCEQEVAFSNQELQVFGFDSPLPHCQLSAMPYGQPWTYCGAIVPNQDPKAFMLIGSGANAGQQFAVQDAGAGVDTVQLLLNVVRDLRGF
jgi:hypothetical protein